MKTSFLIMLLLVAGTAMAQLQTGTKFIGMHAGASLTKTDPYNKTTTYHGSPTLAYFISPKVAIGLHGGYLRSTGEQQGMQVGIGNGYTSYYAFASLVKTTAWNVGTMARYYMPVGERFAFFLENGSGLTVAKVRMDYAALQTQGEPVQGGDPAGSPWGVPTEGGQVSGYNERQQGYVYGNIAPGLVFFATPKLGLELKADMVQLLYNKDLGLQAEAGFNLSKTSVGVGFYF
jgi:hypothetical protein